MVAGRGGAASPAAGTVLGFGVGFGVLTDCTDAYRCTVTACAPCRPAGAWLTGGWAGQGILLLAGVLLAIIGRRRLGPRAVRAGGLAVVGLSVALLVVTTALAVHTY